MFFFILVLGAAMVLLTPDAFAMEETGKGRKLWDAFMLWINFGILVFLFRKYAKKPLLDFFRHERNRIEEDLNKVDTQLREATSIMDAEADKLGSLDERLKEIRDMIVELGQREKEKIIETAKITANQMIEEAKKESQYRLAAAKKALNDEMVDIAVSVVEKRLRKGLTPDDNKTLVERFIADLETSKRHFE
jgi:F-type H+-transporting ATPase subunit b